ncbi:hypothetical protein X975_25618, partial [Stegodyphus mimosarum]
MRCFTFRPILLSFGKMDIVTDLEIANGLSRNFLTPMTFKRRRRKKTSSTGCSQETVEDTLFKYLQPTACVKGIQLSSDEKSREFHRSNHSFVRCNHFNFLNYSKCFKIA